MKQNVQEAMPHYSKIAKGYTQLPEKEALQLWHDYKAGDLSAHHKLFETFSRIALKQAHQYQLTKVPVEDLVQECNLLVLEGIEQFETRWQSIAQFIYFYVHNKIKDYIAKWGVVVQPPRVYDRLKKWDRCMAIAEAMDDVGEIGELSNSYLTNYLNIGNSYIDEIAPIDIIDIIYEETESNREKLLMKLRKSIYQLNQRDRKIIIDYYFERKTIIEIGKELGKTKKWVSDRRDFIVKKLNSLMTKAPTRKGVHIAREEEKDIIDKINDSQLKIIPITPHHIQLTNDTDTVIINKSMKDKYKGWYEPNKNQVNNIKKRVWVNNGEENKNITAGELTLFLQEGWKRGMKHSKKPFKGRRPATWVHTFDKETRVLNDELDTFMKLHPDWHLGRHPKWKK